VDLAASAQDIMAEILMTTSTEVTSALVLVPGLEDITADLGSDITVAKKASKVASKVERRVVITAALLPNAKLCASKFSILCSTKKKFPGFENRL